MCNKNVVNFMPRLFVGLLFLMGGIGKLTMMSPEKFAGMIEANYAIIGLTGTVALVVAWLVIVIEILGGLALLAGTKVSQEIFRCLVKLLILVTLVSIWVHWGNMGAILKNLVIVAVLIQIFDSKIICPLGITGEKE